MNSISARGSGSGCGDDAISDHCPTKEEDTDDTIEDAVDSELSGELLDEFGEEDTHEDGSTSDFEETGPSFGSDDEDDEDHDTQHPADANVKHFLHAQQSSSKSDHGGKDSILPALFACPFGVFPPVVRFSYGGDGSTVEEISARERRKLKWRYTKTTGNLVKAMLNRIGIKPTTKNGWIGQWGAHMKGAAFRKLLPTQIVNHIPGSFCIGRKDSLWRTISRMQALHGRKAFDMLPECFVLPRDRQRLKRAYEESPGAAKWILKPCASARGIGIRVVDRLADIPKNKRLLVQRYIRNPYLINGSKFDLRIYVHVSSYDPLRIYICRDGLARFATQKYTNRRSSTKNRFMHLTNYSVNKNSSSFVSNDDATANEGHKWSVLGLLRYLAEEDGVDTDAVWREICDVVVKTLVAGDGVINSAIKSNCPQRSNIHELFGFDIMLDRNLKAWLVEVNISPSMHSTSQLDRDIKGRLVRDVFNIAGHRLWPDGDYPFKGNSSAPTNTGVAAAAGIPKDATSAQGSTEHKSTAGSGSATTDKFIRCRATLDVGNNKLTAEERAKHAHFTRNPDQAHTILERLTPDDVEILMETEAEALRMGEMQRLFPSATSHSYLKYTDCVRYYNLLLEKWQHKFAGNHVAAVRHLQRVCKSKYVVGMAPFCRRATDRECGGDGFVLMMYMQSLREYVGGDDPWLRQETMALIVADMISPVLMSARQCMSSARGTKQTSVRSETVCRVVCSGLIVTTALS
eukprot:m.923184 g.923184  ORF g.923184 m.923184 type:complete len:744 (+) comp23765_c0_seq2:105-2336(+)